ncbi:MAG: S41 family peptidase [Bacteroidales bacterium]|nr:S41 family peptidase [Bacteroidales bacterium]
MKTKKTIILGLAMFGILFTSCKKDLAENPNNTDYETDVQQFEAVWNGMNTAYALWPIDTTDWDAIYEKYHPLFENMGAENDNVWKTTWNSLTSSLIDHHLNIWLERPSTGYKILLNPGVTEVRARNYCHQQMPSYKHMGHLVTLELDGRLTNVSSTIDSVKSVCSGVLDNDIAYIYISSFNNYYLDLVEAFQHFKNLVADPTIKAAIIDVRDNLGGYADNVHYLVSCFSDNWEYIGYNQTKTGLGRFDLGPKVPFFIGAPYISSGGQTRNIPVVALTNLWSASMSEISTIAIKHLPQGYVVGERTFGATCALSDVFELFYSGSFGDSQMNQYNNWIGHGHYVKTSKYLFTGTDGTIYEGHGVEPDVECLFDQSAWNNYIDNQLECAISFAKEKIIENKK